MKSLLAAAVFGLTFVACNPIDAAIDCHAICSRYAKCFDANYNVGACESRCRENSTTDPSYRNKADSCSACIDDRICATATFACASPCSTVVP